MRHGANKTHFGLVLALTSALVVGCDAGVSAQQHLERAQNYHQQQDLRAAIIEYKAALQQDPENAEARWSLGQAYLTIGDGASAEKEIGFAQRYGKKGNAVMLALARASLLQNRYERTLEILDDTGPLQRSAEGLVIRGEAALGAQDLPQAKTSFQQSLEQNSDNAKAHLGLAKVALIVKDLDEADKQLDQSVQDSDQDAQTWMLKGEVALSRHNAAAAETHFTRAIELDDNSFGARIGLARALLAQQKTPQAGKQIAFVAKNRPDHPLVNYLIAVAAKQNNELAKAKNALLQVRSVAPNHLPSTLLLGTVHYLLKEYGQATHELTRYLAADTRHSGARKLLAASHLKLNAPDRALEVLAPLENQSTADLQLLSLLGSAYIESGNHAKGMGYLEQAAEIAPDAREIRLRLASGQLATGDSDQAIAELNSAIAIDPDFLQAEVMLALIHLRNREFDKVLESAQKIIEKRPDTPLPYNLMAAAYEGKKDPAQARASYRKALSVAPNYTSAMLNLARMDLQADDPQSARQHFEAVLKADEHNPQALLGLATIAKDEKRLDDALQLLERARWHNPGALQPRLILTEIHLQNRAPKKALETVAEAEKLAPRNPQVLRLLGQSQIAAGDLKAGRETLEKLVEFAPQSADAHFRLSIARGAEKDIDGARASLQKAIEIDKRHLPARVALGHLELQTGNIRAAERIARELTKEYPQSPAGYALEGDLRLGQKRTADAVKAYEKAYAITPNRPLMLKLFNAEHTSGETRGAIKRLRHWVDANPEDTGVRLTLAQMLTKNGSQPEAVREYESVLKRQPNNVIALNNLASLYLDTDSKRSLELAKQANDLAPEHASVLDTYGWALVKTGDLQQGLRILKNATLNAPDNRDIRYHLASARAQTGDHEQAKKDLQAIITDGKPFAERKSAEALLKKLQNR